MQSGHKPKNCSGYRGLRAADWGCIRDFGIIIRLHTPTATPQNPHASIIILRSQRVFGIKPNNCSGSGPVFFGSGLIWVNNRVMLLDIHGFLSNLPRQPHLLGYFSPATSKATLPAAHNPNNCSVYDPAARSKPGRGGCVSKWCSFGCRKKIKKVEEKT